MSSWYEWGIVFGIIGFFIVLPKRYKQRSIDRRSKHHDDHDR